MKHRYAFAVVIAVFATLIGPSPDSVAAPPPKGYPSATVVRTVFNPKLAISIPLRRGFYDADADAGFGWDKLWNKHNIWDANAFKALGASPTQTWRGRRVTLKTWAGKMSCGLFGCKVTKQVELNVGVAPYYQKSYTYTYKKKKHTVPIATDKSIYGVVTAFCVGTVRCPNWVTFSLTNPGQHNPFRVTPASSPSGSGQTGSLRGPGSTKNEILVYSYQPLPATLDPDRAAIVARSGLPVSEIVRR